MLTFFLQGHNDVKSTPSHKQINNTKTMVKIRGIDGLTFTPQLYESILYKNLQYLQDCQLFKSFSAEDFVAKGLLHPQKQQYIYLYQQQFLGIETLGLLVDLNLNVQTYFTAQQYKQNVIKKHQKTLKRPHLNEKTYAKNHVGPVLVGHQYNLTIDNLLSQVKANFSPFAAWRTADDRKHKLWRIQHRQRFIKSFQDIATLYILDGHHRFESALINLQTKGQNIKQKDKWIQGLIYSTKYIQTYPQYRELINSNYRIIINNLMLNSKLAIKPLNQYQQDNSQYQLVLLSNGNFYQIKYNENQQCQSSNKSGVEILDSILKQAMNTVDKIGQNTIKFIPSIMFNMKNISNRNYPVFFVKAPNINVIFQKANLQQTLPPKSTWLQPKPCLHMVIRLPY